ncbi:MAG: aspartate dehydrogenase [Lachnospiraceae bacterium]|nr:aspartate dehydrogenase [Lachnospiraceae bacterium]
MFGMRFRKKEINEAIRFDPDTQYAVIRSSICTGEKVAGFKNKMDGHFTEVMLIRDSEDERRFKEMYGLDIVKVEY